MLVRFYLFFPKDYFYLTFAWILLHSEIFGEDCCLFYFDRGMLKRSLKNLIILLLAPVGWLLLFYLSRDFSGFSASVLDIVEMQRIQNNGRALAYKTTDQLFEIFPGAKLEGADAVEVQIVYDPQKLSYFPESFSGNLQERKEKESWLLQVNISLPATFEKSLPIFVLSFSGSQEKILLWEAKASFWGQEQSLAVGNLNIKEDMHWVDEF